MDRISNLPKTILHEILSRLPEKDAARTSVLSKAWKETWSTFPILIFHDERFESTCPGRNQTGHQVMENLKRIRNNFLDFVDSTMQRFHDQHLAIREFNLSMSFLDSQSISHLDHWMNLAIESGVKVLDLSVFLRLHDVSFDKYYCLPPGVVEAKSLKKLILHGEIMLDGGFFNNPAMSSLQELSLNNVYVGEQIIWNSISSCALIEYITLENCFGLKYVKIHGLPRLKGVKIRGIEEVDVDSASLENFSYHPGRRDILCKVNMDQCKNLRDLCLTYPRTIIITNQWLLELFQKFPLLEILTLEHCIFSGRIKFSSPKLKVLNLYDPSKLKEAQIEAPNICLFGFYVEHYVVDQYPMLPNLYFQKHSAQLQIDLEIAIESIWGFQRLRRFLQNFNTNDVQVELHGFCFDLAELLGVGYDLMDDSVLDVYEDFSVHPPIIKSISLYEFPDAEILNLPLLTALLWSCCPSTIITDQYGIAKLLCKKLMEEDDGNCCCCSRQIKCWWNGLKDVRMTLLYIGNDEKVFDCKIMLETLETLSTDSLADIRSFIFEW